MKHRNQITEMRVATNHRLDPGSRYAGEVLSHQGGGTAQKSIRRRHHPADPDGNETFQAAVRSGRVPAETGV